MDITIATVIAIAITVDNTVTIGHELWCNGTKRCQMISRLEVMKIICLHLSRLKHLPWESTGGHQKRTAAMQLDSGGDVAILQNRIIHTLIAPVHGCQAKRLCLQHPSLPCCASSCPCLSGLRLHHRDC